MSWFRCREMYRSADRDLIETHDHYISVPHPGKPGYRHTVGAL